MIRNIAVTLECFVKKGDKCLMLHRHKDKKIMPDIWMAPGGHREFNEGLFECARREIFEETGLKIKNLRIRATGNAYNENPGTEFYFHFLTADYESGTVKGNEKDGVLEWMTLEEITKLDNLLPELKHVLPHIFSDDPTVISIKASYDKNNVLKEFIQE